MIYARQTGKTETLMYKVLEDVFGKEFLRYLWAYEKVKFLDIISELINNDTD